MSAKMPNAGYIMPWVHHPTKPLLHQVSSRQCHPTYSRFLQPKRPIRRYSDCRKPQTLNQNALTPPATPTHIPNPRHTRLGSGPSQSLLRDSTRPIIHFTRKPTNHLASTKRPSASSPPSTTQKRPATTATHPTSPTPLTTAQYHHLSDKYIDSLVLQLEDLAEGRSDIDVEYSAGVLTLLFPPKGTYVLNKQPPNKQIWLSSPFSGPKRYDWVVVGGKEGGGGPGDGGTWMYLRDGSTLDGLLAEELGVKMGDKDRGAESGGEG